MGRTEPSIGRPPAAFRKQQRAKRAKETVSRVLPALFASNARAKHGSQAAELKAEPQPNDSLKLSASGDEVATHGKKSKVKKNGRLAAEEQFDEHTRSTTVSCSTVEHPPHVKIMVTDTLTVASALRKSSHALGNIKKASKSPNIAILNMASLLRPGGGFTSGATSQEEFLCMRTTLLPSLREEFYRLPEVGGVWTPDVLVFRDSSPEAKDLDLNGRYYVDVITAGMIRFPDTITRTTYKDSEGNVTKQRTEEQIYASPADRRLVRRKMRAVCRILQSKGCKRVVLGAWGCGAYENPVGEIASAWKEILLGTSGADTISQKGKAVTDEKWYGLSEVIFAISQNKMASGFARAWGGDIMVERIGSDDQGSDQEEDDPQRDELEDLQAKIEQLRIQVDNARTDMLKDGLQSILDNLQEDLASKSRRPMSNSALHGSSYHLEEEMDGEYDDDLDSDISD